MKRLLLVLTLTLGILLAGGAAGASARPHTLKATSCTGGDVTSLLQGYADNLSGQTLTLAAGKCYVVNGDVNISNTTNLTINGNGATLEQTVAPSSKHPMLDLWHDTNLKIENLTLDGAATPTNPGGGGSEADYGVRMQGDNGVLIAGSTIENVLGDWAYLEPPYSLHDTDALNTNVIFYGDHFLNAGYHGFTVESVGCLSLAPCTGLAIAYSTMTNMGTDAMDFEYDDYSTAFANGVPQQAAQDSILIEDNTWTNWRNDWFASIQGQVPGVQQQHVTLTGNTLDGDGPLFEVVGTPTFSTSPPYLNAYMTITDNSFAPGGYAKPYRGGTSPASQIYSVAGLVMEHNDFPVCTDQYTYPQPTSTCPSASAYEMDLYNISYGVVEQNNFGGTLGVRKPQTYDTQDAHLLLCENTYGPFNNLKLDAPHCLY